MRSELRYVIALHFLHHCLISESFNQISTARDALIHLAYTSTRKLLVPSHQHLDQSAYPRIVLLRSLDDIETASHWRSLDGDLLWDDRYGYQFCHLDFLEMDGSPAVSKTLCSFSTTSNLLGTIVRMVRKTRSAGIFVALVSSTAFDRFH